jgi:hypothetical protein
MPPDGAYCAKLIGGTVLVVSHPDQLRFIVFQKI